MREEQRQVRADASEVGRRDFLRSAAALGAGCLAGSGSYANIAAAADKPSSGKPFSRHDAARIIGNARKIVTPNGIERLEAVRIGGIEQWVFVLGHSWGSYLGLEMAKRLPRWLHAYIGVGQVTNGPESERRGWRFAMDAARRAGNSKAVRELQAIAPYFPPGRASPLKDLYVQRRWVEYYGAAMAYRHDGSAEGNLAELSPDYTDGEIAHIWDGNGFSESHLLGYVLSLDESTTRQLDCPLIVCAGRHDYVVNSELAATWCAEVRAPHKQLVWFENAGHLVMTDEPGKFLVSLLQHARPLAERVGDAPRAG